MAIRTEMTFQIAFMLLLMTIALVAFVKEVFPIEVTALGLLAVLVGTGTIEVRDAIAGFSSTAVVAIGSLMVISHALTKTGVLETVADRMGDSARDKPWPVMIGLLVAVGIGSGVLNNTAVVALAIPLVMKLCRRLEMSPSKILMPLSYASMLGGCLTLIGTSTNLLVNSLVEEAGAEPLGVFEFFGLGSILMAAGMAYIIFGANRLLPDRAATGHLTEKYVVRDYLTELVLEEGSGLVGHNLSETHCNERYGVTVLEVVRKASEAHLEDVATLSLQPGDHLVVQGSLEDILRLRRDQKLALLHDAVLDDEHLEVGNQLLVEAWIAPGSQMIGRTLKQLDFHHHYGAFVLAVQRIGETLRRRLGDVELHLADALLILAPKERLDDLEESGDVKILSEHEAHLRRGPYWWLVLVILPLVVIAATTGWLEIAAGALIGAVLLLLFRVVTPEEAYRSMNWPVLFMIAAFVPVGTAFQVTGSADFLARGLLLASDWAPPELVPYAALAMIYLLTSVLTQIASNNAAAIVIAPIALSMGPSLGISSRPLLFAVCFAASAAFMTPMGYQTNLMVYAAGKYRFADYLRFGTPLSLINWVLATLLIPLFWPF